MRKRKKNGTSAETDAATTRAYQEAPTVQLQDDATEKPMGEAHVHIAASMHIGTRETQQDALFVSPETRTGAIRYAVLCDGMGGMADGERAASETVSIVSARLEGLGASDDIPAALLQIAQEANRRVLSLGIDGTGTTLVIAVVVHNALYWFSVGDSRLYLQRGAEIAQATCDHNYALELSRLVEQGELSQEEADSNPQREALVSYIGVPMLDLCDQNQRPFLLMPEDIVLLCTDGLTKSLSDEMILSILQSPESLEDRAERLPLAALDAAKSGQDNTSVILIQYRGRAQ